MRHTASQIISHFNCRIAVAGDFMLDEYWWGNVSRISPEAPVPVVEYAKRTMVLGGAGNVVMNIRALGGAVAPFGLTGDDDAARELREALGDCPGLVADGARPTTVKRRVMAHHQQLLRIDAESREPAGAALCDAIGAEFDKALPGLGALVVSDYGKGAMPRALFDRLARAAIGAGLPVVLDPKLFSLEGIGAVTVITPNEKEAERFSGRAIRTDADAEHAGAVLLEKTGARHILITRGEHGMCLCGAGGAVVHMPTQAREVYDVTGAGDTVVAVLALALAAGASMEEAARLANLAAGVVVGKLGTAAISREELQSAASGDWPSRTRPRRNA